MLFTENRYIESGERRSEGGGRKINGAQQRKQKMLWL
jgi:hypothetical protein